MPQNGGGELIQNSPVTHAEIYLIALYANNQELMQNLTNSQKMWKWRTKFIDTNAKIYYFYMQIFRNHAKI